MFFVFIVIETQLCFFNVILWTDWLWQNIELDGYYLFFLEICAISKVSRKEIGRCFKLILRALETSVDLITSGDFMVSDSNSLLLNDFG